MTWAHLSHANILPLYGACLDGEDYPFSLVSPQMTKGDIAHSAKMLSQVARMPLVRSFLHHLSTTILTQALRYPTLLTDCAIYIAWILSMEL